MTILQICGLCNKEFQQKSSHRIYGVRFCSVPCYRNFVKKTTKNCLACAKGFTGRDNTSKFCSVLCAWSSGLKKATKGIKRPYHQGEKHPNWKGNSSENHRLRNSLEMRLWREAIFKRDDYRCMSCGERGLEIHADHILPFALFPRLRFDLNNGRTLCVGCHRNTETYMGKVNKFSIEGRPVVHLTQ